VIPTASTSTRPCGTIAQDADFNGDATVGFAGRIGGLMADCAYPIIRMRVAIDTKALFSALHSHARALLDFDDWHWVRTGQCRKDRPTSQPGRGRSGCGPA